MIEFVVFDYVAYFTVKCFDLFLFHIPVRRASIGFQLTRFILHCLKTRCMIKISLAAKSPVDISFNSRNSVPFIPSVKFLLHSALTPFLFSLELAQNKTDITSSTNLVILCFLFKNMIFQFCFFRQSRNDT